jgi:2-C-methyl-D-erythritol 2,4-cyclodiphosphate synthase
MRIGIGYDVHQLVSGRKLIMGGVEIPYDKGLLGHSDADVLIHALMDALLGALSLGSIGDHFPDTDPTYKGADSKKLLEHVVQLIHKKGYRVENIDSVILCEAPKLKPYIETMRQRLATLLGVSIDAVGIKATTTEKLGYVGRGEGIAAEAVVLLKKA